MLGIHCRRPAIHTQYVCLCLGNCYSRFTLQLYNIQLKTLFTENKHKHVLTFRTDLNLPSSSSSSLLFSLSFALSPAIHDFGNLLYRPHLFRDTQYFLLGRALYRLPRGHRSLQWETTFLLKALCYHIQYPPPPRKMRWWPFQEQSFSTDVSWKKIRSLATVKTKLFYTRKCTLLVQFSVTLMATVLFLKPQVPSDRVSSRTSEQVPPFEKHCCCDTCALRKYFISVTWILFEYLLLSSVSMFRCHIKTSERP